MSWNLKYKFSQKSQNQAHTFYQWVFLGNNYGKICGKTPP